MSVSAYHFRECESRSFSQEGSLLINEVVKGKMTSETIRRGNVDRGTVRIPSIVGVHGSLRFLDNKKLFFFFPLKLLQIPEIVNNIPSS